MEEQIDREFEQLSRQESVSADAAVVRRNTLFIRMVTLSILLHLAFAPLAFLPGQRSGGVPFSSVISVNLDSAPPLPAQAPPVASVPPVETVPEEPVAPPPPVPEPKATPTEAEKLREKVSEAVAGGQNKPELLEQSSFGLGLSLGYFSSLAEGRTLKDDIKQYYFSMLRKINEQWWLTGAQSIRTPQIPLVNVVLARNGEIIERVLEQSSGDREYDRKILQALDAAAPFPPLPESFRMPYFKAPLRLVAPLNFLLPGSEPVPQGHS